MRIDLRKSLGLLSLLVCLLFAFLITGCTNSSTHGTEKELDVKLTINNNGGGDVNITSPLTLDSASETAQDTANTATTSPTTRLQLTEGGSTAAGEGSELKDVASTLKNKLNSENKTKTENNQPAGKTEAVSVPGKPDAADKEETPKGGDIDGTTGSTKPILWKPVADSGGMLVVLLPANMGNPSVVVADMSGTDIETGDFVYYSNPDRATYRFKRPGASFPSPCLLKVGNDLYLVKESGKRNESLPSYTMATAAP